MCLTTALRRWCYASFKTCHTSWHLPVKNCTSFYWFWLFQPLLNHCSLYLATEWQPHAGEMPLSAVTGKAGLHHALRSPCWTPGQYMSQVKQLRYTHCCWAAEGSLRRPQTPKVTQNLKDHLKCKTWIIFQKKFEYQVVIIPTRWIWLNRYLK